MTKTHVSAEVTATDAPGKAPLVVEIKKKKKKRYSSSTSRSLQELESGVTKSARKVAKAVREGLDEYADRSEESSAKKKDGVFRDLLRNQSKALRKALPIAAEAPADMLDAVADMKSVRRLFRK